MKKTETKFRSVRDYKIGAAKGKDELLQELCGRHGLHDELKEHKLLRGIAEEG